MKTESNSKAGGKGAQHNNRAPRGMKVKSRVKSGIVFIE